MGAFRTQKLTWQALPALLNTAPPDAPQILTALFSRDLPSAGIKFPDVQLRRRMFVNLMYERCQWLARYGQYAQFASEEDMAISPHLRCSYFFEQLLLESGTICHVVIFYEN